MRIGICFVGDNQLNQPDNLEFQSGSGAVYVIEDNGLGDMAAYVAVQHSADPANALVDGYNTDDLVIVSGFAAVDAATARSHGVATAARLASESQTLFGFGTPLLMSVGQ